MPTAYCLKCRSKVEIKSPKHHKARVSGTCANCNGKVSVFVKKHKKLYKE